LTISGSSIQRLHSLNWMRRTSIQTYLSNSPNITSTFIRFQFASNICRFATYQMHFRHIATQESIDSSNHWELELEVDLN
jgi:hypothetical protein